MPLSIVVERTEGEQLIAAVQADPELARLVGLAPGMHEIVEFAQQVSVA